VLNALSTSQFISVLLIPLAIVMLIRLAGRGTSPEPAQVAARRPKGRARRPAA
jgi:hypothetical protein